MTHTEKTKMLHSELKEKYPDIDSILVRAFIENMPDEAFVSMLFFENEKAEDYHIRTKEQYDKAVEFFEWVDDKGTGAKWTVDEIVKLSGINFDNKEYTKYDYAYMVNMHYSDYCNIFTEPTYYLKMSKNDLDDPDYCGEPSERAYCNAKKRIKYNID